MDEYRTVRLLKIIKTLMRKMKTTKNNINDEERILLKKLIKLRKWMDSIEHNENFLGDY